MREILECDLVPGVTYYIQRNRCIDANGVCYGNGKQKGVFKRHMQHDPNYVKWNVFHHRVDATQTDSGYGGSDTDHEFHCNSQITKYYLPEADNIMTNHILRNLIDPYFVYSY